MFDLFFTSEGRMFGEAGYNGSIKIGNFSEKFLLQQYIFQCTPVSGTVACGSGKSAVKREIVFSGKCL
ncbi:hypothetical protein RI056_15425 [Komagataeibacter nataicola]|nr:hypothetical protein RI056_15425 [Komagataeibacter nataicola]